MGLALSPPFGPRQSAFQIFPLLRRDKAAVYSLINDAHPDAAHRFINIFMKSLRVVP
jgi:hypothetical protein